MRLAEVLGFPDPLEASQAQLEALERDGAKPRSNKLKRCVRGKGPPRDELGRFTKLRAARANKPRRNN